jgi:hypothetical protein
VLCEHCGKEFKKRRDKNKFCSKKCHYESKGCKKECKQCGHEFKVHPHQLEIVVFCSHNCREKHYLPFDVNGVFSKKCTSCDEIKSVDDFYKRKNLKSGLNSSCKVCENNRRSKFNQTNSGKVATRKHARTISRRFQSAKSNAVRRCIVWDISKPDYIALVENSVCHYCFKKLDEAGGGLDRKNNSKTYNLSEVVPCCGRCNKTFMDNYNYQEKLQLAEVIRTIDKNRSS